MTSIVRQSIPIVLALVFICFLAASQNAVAQPYTLNGQVMERTMGGAGPRPITGATVRLTPGRFRIKTDENGNYTIGGLKRRSYTVYVSAPNHRSVRRRIRVRADMTLNVDLSIVGQEQPTTMPNGELPMKSGKEKKPE